MNRFINAWDNGVKAWNRGALWMLVVSIVASVLYLLYETAATHPKQLLWVVVPIAIIYLPWAIGKFLEALE